LNTKVLVEHEVCRKEVTNAKGRMPKNYRSLISMGWIIWRIVDG
jgi:hypothetical protein